MRKKKFTNFTQNTHELLGMQKDHPKQKPEGKPNLKIWKIMWALPLFLLGFSQISSAQCALICNDNVNVSLPGTNENCSVEITPDMVLEEGVNCVNPLIVIISDQQGNVIPNSPIVDESYIGQTLVYSVQEDIPGGNSCWGTMDIEDKLGPNIVDCNDLDIYCLEGNIPTLDGGNVPSPSFSDCSGYVNYTYIDDVLEGTCVPGGISTAYTEIITRTWTVTDAFGNISTCTQIITVLRVGLDNFTPDCPQQIAFTCTSSGFPDISPAATGYPSIDLGGGLVIDVVPGANNTCSIASSFQDEVLEVCGGGQKILRTWTVYDWCQPTQPGFNPLSCIQQIKITDELAPTITCPASVVSSSVSSACAATVILPPATVMDECSSFNVKINTPFGQILGNGGLLPNVAVGVYDLTYIATDECNNFSSCIVTLTVEDNTPPVVICDEFTVVSLSDSVAVVSAQIFDDGSQDNCQIDYYEIRRMPNSCQPAGTDFGPFVEFDCCDVNNNVMISLRVFDIYGNLNSCMIEVEIQDKINPTIICPADKTIDCGNPIPDIQEPIVVDNCTATYEVTENEQITNCGVGNVFRTFIATDLQGLTASCIQTVTIVNNDPFTLADIIWPQDFSSYECGPDLNPNNLSAPYDYPTTNESVCDLIAITYTDQDLPVNLPACGKILRRWIIIDWCQYDPNIFNSGGYWEHVQVLKIIDVENPVVACPADISVSSFAPNCDQDFVNIPLITAMDCSESFNFFYEIDLYNNGSVDQTGVGANVSGNYPFGAHTIEYTVEDMCGNITPCSFEITIRDGKKPTPVCLNGLAVELMSDPDGDGGMIEVAAELMDSGSYDNCTEDNDLQLVLQPNFFTCADKGTNIVTLTVYDLAGNSDFCETYIIIQDNMNICPEQLSVADVGGMVANEMGEGVDDVTINISGNGDAMSPSATNVGLYQFSDLPMYQDYTFTPSNNDGPKNGVTTLDLVKITKHILGITKLDSPYKIIAADANHSNSVTTLDVVHIRKLILNINSSFPNSESWRFVDADFEFPDPTNPFSSSFPEYNNINNLNENDMNVNFVGIKIGDVNNTASPNNILGADDRSFDGELNFQITDRGLKAGETYRVDFKTSDFLNIFGYQFTLDFDENALELVDIIPGELENLSENNFGLTMIDKGIITSSWDNTKNTLHNDGTVLFSLIFISNTNTTLSNLLKITSEYTPAEAYQADLNQGTNLLSVNLKFTEGTGEESHDTFMLYQNKPNPFNSETAIAWEMPQAGWAKLTILDFSGKVIKVISDDYPIGYNQVILTREELGGAQMMFYRLENACAIATKKMIMLD